MGKMVTIQPPLYENDASYAYRFVTSRKPAHQYLTQQTYGF